mmetsp:Transcript_11618/g.12709  ORF Transcript_11618/g.12709 Transcript_11618/m.12709 type:complete len:510 (+) Transcript_11618:239-1768(+)
MKFSSVAGLCCFLTTTTTNIFISASPEVVQKDPIKIENDPNGLNPDDIRYVVGGDPSEDGEFPYYVLMRDGKSSNAFGFCGGSLIAPRVVLTAAHCQPENNIGNFITVGPTDRNSLDNGSSQRARNIKSQAAVPHPDYNPDSESNDFALVLLKEEYIIDSGIQLVLNDESSFPPAGDVLDVLGMGTLASSGDLADELRDVKVKSFSNSQCKSDFYGNSITENMICAGYEEGGKDSCQGDSGGPLVKIVGNTHTQVGVVSYGYGCASPNKPGVYSRVSAQIDWMRDQICDEWEVESSLCGPTTPPAPTISPAPTPRPTSALPTPAPTSRPTFAPDPLFEKLGTGYCRDFAGNYNEDNWEANYYCVDLPTCQEECKNQNECVGVAWALDPSTDDNGCKSNSLPRCVVYYSKVAPAVAIVTQASGSPEEYTAYRYKFPVVSPPTPEPTPEPTVFDDVECGDNSEFRWKGKAKFNCGWVAKKKGRGKNRCGKKAGGGQSGRVRDYCQETCDQC